MTSLNQGLSPQRQRRQRRETLGISNLGQCAAVPTALVVGSLGGSEIEHKRAGPYISPMKFKDVKICVVSDEVW